MDDTINQGWKAKLTLGFVHNGSKTILQKRRHYGPLTVQRPFYPEGDLCHVYVLHPPGGVVGGDQLAIDVNVEDKAKALITMPGAGKFYRSSGAMASQQISLQIQKGACLEWLPQETILYEGARLNSELSINLQEDAHFMAWEIIALGRPAAKEGFKYGDAELNWRVFRDGQPLFLEKLHLNHQVFMARWGLNGYSSSGTLLASSASRANLEAVRALIAEQPNKGVTLMDDLLICRASADNSATVRAFFEQVRALIRNDIVRKPAYTPRIWAT